MRSVFLYEFVTGGGCWSLGDDPPAGSLLAEGTAMRDAIAMDLALIESVKEIHLFHDVRLPRPDLPKQRLYEIHNQSDVFFWLTEMIVEANTAVLVAPEFSADFPAFAELWEVLAAGPLLSPGSQIIDLCSNKQRTCEHLTEHGIPSPRGISFSNLPQKLDPALFPAVLKPIDGAGSQSVQLVHDNATLASLDLTTVSGWRLEKFHRGTPISVSLLAGPLGFIALQPCTQRLSDDGRFTYHGGSTPLPPQLAERAQRLALAAANTLPKTRGYLGIDMVLGSGENGKDDVVIEINPRLTTSYLGLRQACEQNLAEAMLKWAEGEPIELTWRPETIEFAVSQSINQP